MGNFRFLSSRKPTEAAQTTTSPAAPKRSSLPSLSSIVALYKSYRLRSKEKRRHHRRIIHINMRTDLPRLFITADTNEFDPSELSKWQAEGYEVEYIPRADTQTLELLADTIESSEKYCIIAYGTAATIALEYAMYPVGNLTGLIAYYPTGLPSYFTSQQFPKRVRHILLHISDSQPFGFDPATVDHPSLKVRIYQDTKPGFAEKITVNYSPTATGLAHSRTLAILRESLGPKIDLEDVWGEHLLYEFVEKDASKTLDTMAKEPYVNHVPTLTGGFGYTDLHRFYHSYFIHDNPPSLRLRLISRTVGSDRIVDEMICAFTHTTEIHWMLPGVKPTDRKVEIPIVVIVCVKGQKVFAEHIYWDQASVLKQIGAVDFTGLPVSGPEQAWKVEDKNSVPSNIMLAGWEAPISEEGSSRLEE